MTELQNKKDRKKYYKNYYLKNKEKIKERSYNNYHKKEIIKFNIKSGNFIVNFN